MAAEGVVHEAAALVELAKTNKGFRSVDIKKVTSCAKKIEVALKDKRVSQLLCDTFEDCESETEGAKPESKGENVVGALRAHLPQLLDLKTLLHGVSPTQGRPSPTAEQMRDAWLSAKTTMPEIAPYPLLVVLKRRCTELCEALHWKELLCVLEHQSSKAHAAMSCCLLPSDQQVTEKGKLM